jgi:hypothetical protein
MNLTNTLPPREAVAGMVPASVLTYALEVVRILGHQSRIVPRPGGPTEACQALARAGVLVSSAPGEWSVAGSQEVVL